MIDILKQIGVDVVCEKDQIIPRLIRKIRPADLETRPYPGFPTDLQAQLTTLLTQANGISRIRETIFNNRFKHTDELNKLGANIEVNNDISIIRGKTDLKGNVLSATDLRASAALVLGGLIAAGETIVENSYQLFRGYENMPEKLKHLGAEIKVLKE